MGAEVIAFLIDQITGGIWPYLVAGFTALIGIAGLYFKGRGDAKRRIETAALKDTLKGIQSGTKGAAKASADLATGKTPEEIVRANDGAWDDK